MKNITKKELKEVQEYIKKVYGKNYFIFRTGIKNNFFKVRSGTKFISKTLVKDLSEDSFNFRFIGFGADRESIYALFSNKQFPH